MVSKLNPRPSGLNREEFIAHFGGIYEHSPWVAERIFDDGVGEQDDIGEYLAQRMQACVDAAPEERQKALLLAHPDLAGRLKLEGESLTSSSQAEQASAGLDRCSPEEYERFQTLNQTYRARFGFPFIIAVRGLGRDDILKAFELRVRNSEREEFSEALRQVHKIARLRLELMA